MVMATIALCKQVTYLHLKPPALILNELWLSFLFFLIVCLLYSSTSFQKFYPLRIFLGGSLN